MRATPERIDEIDEEEVVALLVQDGRRSFGDIGNRVSLSAPSVKRRVDRLRERGTIVESLTSRRQASVRRRVVRCPAQQLARGVV